MIKKERNKKNRKFDIDKVPFIPAFDLLEKKNNELNEEEAAAVGLALFLSLNGSIKSGKSKWELNARKESLAQRI
jgi:hypothetical protein